MYFRKQSPAVVRRDAVTTEMLFHFMFYLLVWVSQRSFCEEFSCWEQEERVLLGIRKVISQDCCYAGSKPSFISKSSYVTWRAKHSPHTTSWTEGCFCAEFVLLDLQDTTLHICHAIWGNVGDQNHQQDRLLSSSHTNLTVTIIFKVVAAHLHESNICVLLPGQLASRDFLMKLCMTDYAHSTYYRTWSLKDMNILEWVRWRVAETIKVWSTCHTRRAGTAQSRE